MQHQSIQVADRCSHLIGRQQWHSQSQHDYQQSMSQPLTGSYGSSANMFIGQPVGMPMRGSVVELPASSQQIGQSQHFSQSASSAGLSVSPGLHIQDTAAFSPSPSRYTARNDTYSTPPSMTAGPGRRPNDPFLAQTSQSPMAALRFPPDSVSDSTSNSMQI